MEDTDHSMDEPDLSDIIQTHADSASTYVERNIRIRNLSSLDICLSQTLMSPSLLTLILMIPWFRMLLDLLGILRGRGPPASSTPPLAPVAPPETPAHVRDEYVPPKHPEDESEVAD